jgi:hypothetical protein
MKLLTLFPQVAIATVLGTAGGFCFDFGALGLFSAATCTLLALVVATDYSRRQRYATNVSVILARRRERMPLAA